SGRAMTSLNRLLTRFLFAGVAVGPATAGAAEPRALYDDVSRGDDDLDNDDVDDDVVDAAMQAMTMGRESRVAARRMRELLEDMDAFDATRTAALAAICPNPGVRLAIADALASRQRIVGAGFVLDMLVRDRDAAVRAAATRTIGVRRVLRG